MVRYNSLSWGQCEVPRPVETTQMEKYRQRRNTLGTILGPRQPVRSGRPRQPQEGRMERKVGTQASDKWETMQILRFNSVWRRRKSWALCKGNYWIRCLTAYKLFGEAPHTSHSALHTPLHASHSTHITLHTLHSTLPLHTSHSPLHTSHSSLHNAHSPLHTPHFKLHTSHFAITAQSHPRLHTSQSPLHTPHLHSPLHASHSPLHTPHHKETPNETLKKP